MDIYAEIILDHFKNPRNKGLIAEAQVHGKDLNPLCGDQVTISLKVNDEDEIEKYGFEGSGCAISMAAASMLGEQLTGMKLAEVEKISQEKMVEWLGVEISAARVKCALLALSCIKKAIKIYIHQKNERG
jgi:nitrogen fixation protein NifU and related proteins